MIDSYDISHKNQILIPALWNIGILLDKQATLGKHFGPDVTPDIYIT